MALLNTRYNRTKMTVLSVSIDILSSLSYNPLVVYLPNSLYHSVLVQHLTGMSHGVTHQICRMSHVM
jgi:hypothetical protein